jgi:mRNA interferase HigB
LRLQFLVEAASWSIGVGVRVISKTRLKAFWESRKGDSQRAERDFTAWYKLAVHGDWANFGQLKQTFGTADSVGDCVVFDVGNNRFRLIGRVNYRKGILYVLKAMDHSEYDKGFWIQECGCHEPRPKKRAPVKKTLPQKAPPRSGRNEGG